MKRRDFLITTALGAGASAVESCTPGQEQLIPLLVPEEQLIPGVEYWTASVCRQCPAGCGIQVKTMLGEAIKSVEGREARVQIRQAKKIEGNPHHPLNRGKLCARGQAGLQVLYNPDRLRSPLRRTGPRGTDQYEEISWEEAIGALAEELRQLRQDGEASTLLFLTGRLPGHLGKLAERFTRSLGSPNHVSWQLFGDESVRAANRMTMQRSTFATFDVENARYVISFGAGFLENWQSPVFYGLGFGNMRQGRPGQRGKLVHVEPRFSMTAANADEWLPILPGSEGALALSMAHVIIQENLHDERFVESRCRGFDRFRNLVMEEYSPSDVAPVAGIDAEKIIRIAREFATQQPGLALGGGSTAAHTNGVFNIAAVHALNALVGSLDRPGGISFAPDPPFAQLPPLPPPLERQESLGVPRLDREGDSSSMATLMGNLLSGEPYPVKALLLYDCNPLFALPRALQAREALQGIPFIASFSRFMDESTAMADLILPDHTYLESWWDDVPEPGVSRPTASLAQPVVKPLYNTRSTADVLLEMARATGEDLRAAFPWDTFQDLLREAYRGLHEASGSEHGFDEFWEELLEKGVWQEESSLSEQESRAPTVFDFSAALSQQRRAKLTGDPGQYPFYLYIYPSTHYEGEGANQSWLQELPDPMTSVVWGSWAEINPRSARELGIREGDVLSIESPHGTIQAPALLFPGARPDTIGIPVGQGHEAYGRYARGRGANPIRVATPVFDPASGGLAWAATRVRVSKSPGRLPLVKVGHSLEQKEEG